MLIVGMYMGISLVKFVIRGNSAYFGKRSLVIWEFLSTKMPNLGIFLSIKFHFGKILCALILLNQFIFLYQYTEKNTSYSPCERQKIIA